MTATMEAVDVSNEQFHSQVIMIMALYASVKDKMDAEEILLELIPEKERPALIAKLAKLHNQDKFN